jgi:hypothetical protein
MQFWRLTPAMFHELMGRRRALLLTETWHIGVLASVTANQWRSADSPMSQPWDFFPELSEMRPKSILSDVKKTPAQLFDIAKAITMALGGVVLKDRYSEN